MLMHMCTCRRWRLTAPSRLACVASQTYSDDRPGSILSASFSPAPRGAALSPPPAPAVRRKHPELQPLHMDFSVWSELYVHCLSRYCCMILRTRVLRYTQLLFPSRGRTSRPANKERITLLAKRALFSGGVDVHVFGGRYMAPCSAQLYVCAHKITDSFLHGYRLPYCFVDDVGMD